MLILKTLARGGEMHGFEIADSIQQISDEVLQVGKGSLYPALQGMLIQGWRTAEWGKPAENGGARYYRLTSSGRKHLDREMRDYERVAQAIARVLQPA